MFTPRSQLSSRFNFRNVVFPSLYVLLSISATFGCLASLSGCIVVAWLARQCELMGQPMPNGKGGLMSFQDGYEVAAVLLIISIFGLITACKFWRSRSSQSLNDART